MTGQRAMFDLRRQLMAHLQTLDLRFSITIRSGGW